ncbi:hypothetical protein IF2G_00267 [Cordyceps javanica]|nr:hypothetical protein IF2G_00267 [Cordyceps javanica]
MHLVRGSAEDTIFRSCACVRTEYMDQRPRPTTAGSQYVQVHSYLVRTGKICRMHLIHGAATSSMVVKGEGVAWLPGC